MNLMVQIKLQSSKSLVNRYLLLDELFQELEVNFHSQAEDVSFLSTALSQHKKHNEFYLGRGGTSFRFFSVFISAYPGDYKIELHPDLLQRPHHDLLALFDQLNVSAEFRANSLIIQSTGWSLNSSYSLDLSVTTQVATAFILMLTSNAPISGVTLEFQSLSKASGYLQATLDLLRSLKQSSSLNTFVINKNQVQVYPLQPLAQKIKVEPDASSAFCVMCFSIFCNDISLDLKASSLQPDIEGVACLMKMGVDVEATAESIKVKKIDNKLGVLKCLNINLQKQPDLFCMLAGLCIFAEGVSHLRGLEALGYKESHRLNKVCELFDLLGVRYNKHSENSLSIFGSSGFIFPSQNQVQFDVSSDHRLVMLGEFLKFKGAQLVLLGSESVSKSFPNFYDVLEKLRALK